LSFVFSYRDGVEKRCTLPGKGWGAKSKAIEFSRASDVNPSNESGTSLKRFITKSVTNKNK
jgi:hypothetical protein